MIRPLARLACGLLAVAMLAPVEGAAQAASINVQVEISTTALSIATVQDLDFGTVLPGSPTSLDPRAAATAGEFELHGARGAEIMVTFTLPSNLVVGPHQMPIAFGITSGCHVPLFGGLRFSCSAFDPNAPLITQIPNWPPPYNVRLFWLGGTVAPIPTQFPGLYRGTITLTAAYTGN